jgi:P27 family predicted phage terminase small subunit
MTAGRRPTPDAVKSKTRAVRSKREPKNLEAAAESSAPASAQILPAGPRAPTWLKAEHGLEIWERLAPTLALAKLLTAADADAFGRYCRNFARWLKLQDELDAGGETYVSVSAHGELKRANPAFVMSERLERMLLAVEDRFGLNPAERQRIMAARAQTGVPADLFGAEKPPAGGKEEKGRREDDPAATPAEPAQPIASPIGLLN